MEVKKSMTKRIGVKSIHYVKSDKDNKYNVYLEDGFNRDFLSDKISSKIKYNDVDTLDKLMDKQTYDKGLIVTDIENYNGFTLSRDNKFSSGSCKDRVSILNIVNDSYSSSLLKSKFSGLNSNNIDIQILHNCIDLKKIIGLYVNDINLSIQSRTVDKPFDEYNDEDNVDIISQFYTRRQKLYVENNNDYIEKLKKGTYIFRSFPIRILYKEDEKHNNELTHNIFNLLSDFRNFTSHANNANTKDGYSFFETLKFDTKYMSQFSKAFINEFNKTSGKTLSIIEEYYKTSSKNPFESLRFNKQLAKDYCEFVLCGKAANFDISLNNLQKAIMRDPIVVEILEEYKLNNIENYSEYLNKLKSILKYLLYKQLTCFYKNKISKYVQDLTLSNDKEITYQEIGSDVITHKLINVERLSSIIEDYVGVEKCKYKNAYNLKLETNNHFINDLFFLSLFLTTKYANSFFSDVLNKYKAILDLLKLRRAIENDGYSFNIKYSEMNKIFNLLPCVFDFSKAKDNAYLESILNNILIVKGYRAKCSQDRKNITELDYKYIYQSLTSNDLSYDEFDKELNNKKGNKYPLKNFVGKQIYESKYYAYISSYVGANYVREVMRNETIVRYAMRYIYEVNGAIADDFFSKIYKSFYSITNKSLEVSKLTNKQKDKLVQIICSLTLDNINDSIFNKSKVNYSALVRAYYFIAYLIVKNIVTVNKSFYIAYLDYEIYNDIIGNKRQKKPFLLLSNYKRYLNNKYNKLNKSKEQINALFNNKYYSHFIENENENKNYTNDASLQLQRYVRNYIEHSNILNVNKVDLSNITELTSFYDLYCQLLQNHFINEEHMKAFLSVVDKNGAFKKKITKGNTHSTTFNVLLFLQFAYNTSRFNKLTVEKYYINSFKN